MKIDWKLIWEAIKEPLREIVLAALPGLLAYLGTLDAQWAVLLYIILRAVDSVLHEYGKARSTAKEQSIYTLGLTRF